uniref:Small-subunit processome Utp12 domain-containing protein n=1 Tax=Panagrolaimus superbus TaxID=310955 RepID=A0A914YCL1_9BILA
MPQKPTTRSRQSSTGSNRSQTRQKNDSESNSIKDDITASLKSNDVLPTSNGAVDKSEAFKDLVTESKMATSGGTSFVVLLSQGIVGNDEEKIESVVKNSDPATVLATVKNLPVIHVIPFLNILEQTFRRDKVKQPHVWMNWVQAVLSIHMGYLSSVCLSPI